MKTAISVPDDIYSRAERKSEELGWSRSHLYAKAVSHYLDHLDKDRTLQAINDTVAALKNNPDSSNQDAVQASRRGLAKVTW